MSVDPTLGEQGAAAQAQMVGSGGGQMSNRRAHGQDRLWQSLEQIRNTQGAIKCRVKATGK
jgi:hypothetical protein